MYGSLITVTNRQIRSYRLDTTTTLAGDSLAFTGDGRPPSEWRFLGPTATIRDTAGNVYISDTGNGRIRRIDPGGKLATIMTLLEGPAYLALNRLDELYLSDSKAGVIYRIGKDGKSQVYLERFSNSAASAAFRRGLRCGQSVVRRRFGQRPDPENRDRWLRFAIAGGGTSFDDGFATSIALKNPTGVAVDKEGTIWFTETGRLRRMRTDGRVTTLPGIPLVDPRGIHMDNHDRLIVADAGANQIYRVTTNGKWEAIAGSARTLSASTDAWPESDGSILVSDSGNNRIRQLKPLEAAPIVTSPVETGTSVENGDGSLNSPARPATRTGTVKLRVPAPAGTATPYVVAEIAASRFRPFESTTQTASTRSFSSYRGIPSLGTTLVAMDHRRRSTGR